LYLQANKPAKRFREMAAWLVVLANVVIGLHCLGEASEASGGHFRIPETNTKPKKEL